MRGHTIAALAGLSSLASSQLIDLGYVDRLPDPTYTIASDVPAQTIAYNQATAIASVVAVALASPVPDVGDGEIQARHVVEKRAPCENTYTTPNVYNAVLDPAERFLSDENLANQAQSAVTPSGYTRVYQNLKKAAQANGYMGYSIMSGYNVQECADRCTRALGCQGFNTYFERSPSKAPAPACRDPPGTANPFCVLWGGPLSTDNARNEGQWREQFHVVIAGSNGYVLTSSLNPLSNKAINAPLDCNNDDSYMGMRLLTDNAPFDPQRCAAICEATSQYNIQHHDPATSPRLCKFYNTYILNKNYISQGQACSMYTQKWEPSVYAVNDGQWDGQGNHYTISSSVFFSNQTDVVTPVCPADITRLQSDTDAGAFCTSYNSYVAPPATTITSYTGTTTVEACGAPTAHAKRDANSGAVVEAVVAVYPSKVDNAAITGTIPALVTIPAERLSIPSAYASATSEAIAELGGGAVTSAASSPSAPAATSVSSGSVSSAATVTTPQATPTAPAQKRAAGTPPIFAGRDSIQISSACSRIISSGTPTVRVQAQATETTYNNCAQYPSVCQNGSPAQIIAGSFTSASSNIDDVSFTVSLPFPICIYDQCSTTVHPTSNGIITLGDYATNIYANENSGFPYSGFGSNGVLAAFFDDLYIYSGQRHYMDYSLCGSAGQRTVTFDWRMGRFSAPSNGPLYSFSVTFYEDQPSRVYLKYFGTTDQGSSASVGMQGTTGGQATSYKFSHDQTLITNGLGLIFDPRAGYFGVAGSR